MKKLYIFALVAAMFAACATDAVDEQSVKVEEQTPDTLVGTFEGEDSRIQLENGKTVWTEGDLVSVFYLSNANQKWQYQGETGERTGKLKRIANPEGSQEMPSVVVVYPYNENYYINYRTCNVKAWLPATQTYLKDSYGLDGNIMVSQSEYNQFSLKNVCGWLKIQLTGNGEKVKSIKLKGNNCEQVAGQIYINSATAEATLASEMGGADDNENGAGGNLVFDDTILTEVTLNCGEGVTLSSEATAFYIALPPQTFEKGLTIEVAYADSSIMTKSTDKVVVIERNHIQPLTSIEIPTAVFSLKFANVSCGNADCAITPVDNEMLYLLASSQDLGQYGILGTTPTELMQNYAKLLVDNCMITRQPDFWFVFKGDMATADVWKQASRWDAKEEVTVYAVGFNITASKTDSYYGTYATAIEFSTAIHEWAVPFLPYPSVTVPEAQLTSNVSSAAGEVVLDCVLENPLTDGSEITLLTEAAWVHPTWADNKLTIAYDANTAAAARRAKIVIEYGWWINPVEVTLVQEKDPNAVAVTLAITVKGTQFNGILVDIVPSDANATFALNYTTPELDWETGAEVAIDWMAKAEELLSYPGNASFHKGALTNYLIKTNVSNYEWNGLDYYVYAVPVEATSENDNWTVSQILGETAVSEKVTIDISKMPKLEWDVEKSGLTWNETNERYDLEVVEGSTVVLYYNLTNPVEGASVKLNGTSLYDSYNVVDGEPVIDNAAGTITFKIDKFDAAKRYHYVSPGFKYTNETEDMWGVTTPSLRLTQVENKGYALPYQESFANGLGEWTIENISLESGLSYVWKHESGNYGSYAKASAFAGSAKAAESMLVSPKIDLTKATMPGMQFSHAHKFAADPKVDLTLWVKEASAAEWTQVTIPTYGTNTNWTFVTAAVDLSAYAGKSIQVAFKYTSTSSAAATWEIKDVVVYDAGGVAM